MELHSNDLQDDGPRFIGLDLEDGGSCELRVDKTLFDTRSLLSQNFLDPDKLLDFFDCFELQLGDFDKEFAFWDADLEGNGMMTSWVMLGTGS